jgi:endonuclease/exonuclease/phosphatase family metal-dependent hydrolase
MRVVTYNIWNVEGGWEDRSRSLVTLLREVRPDILGLQEACVSEMDADQAQEMAAALELEMVCCRLPYPHRGTEFQMGNVVLSRWPITDWDSTVLPSPESNRCCVRAGIDTPRGTVQVFVLHLSSDLDQGALRESQVRHALEWSEPFAGEPCLLLGDFNAAPETREIRSVTRPETGPPWTDAWTAARPGDPGLTSVRENPYRRHRAKPDRRVDYIFLRDPGGRWRPGAARLLGEREVCGVVPSDHYGVCVDFEPATATGSA